MRISKDLWLALVVLVMSGIAAMLTHNLSTGGVSTDLGPAFYPWLMVICMFCCSLVLLGRALWQKQKVQESESPSINLKVLSKLSLFLVYMILYAYFYVEAGYLISTCIFFVLSMLTLKERRYMHFLVVPVCITVGVYLVFTKILSVYIP